MCPRDAGLNAVDDTILEFFAEPAEGDILSPLIVWWNLSKKRMFSTRVEKQLLAGYGSY